MLRELVCRFPQKWYRNLLLNGSSMIWTGRQRGGAGVCEGGVWAGGAGDAGWSKRLSLESGLKTKTRGRARTSQGG